MCEIKHFHHNSSLELFFLAEISLSQNSKLFNTHLSEKLFIQFDSPLKRESEFFFKQKYLYTKM